MSGGKRPGTRGRSRADSVEESRTASLTADLMLRGRKRGRELLNTTLAEAARGPRAASDPRSLLAAVSRRDIALVILWAAVFAGCFLLARFTG